MLDPLLIQDHCGSMSMLVQECDFVISTTWFHIIYFYIFVIIVCHFIGHILRQVVYRSKQKAIECNVYLRKYSHKTSSHDCWIGCQKAKS